MRVAIVAGKAISLINVARDIAYVVQKKGYSPRLLTYIESPLSLSRLSDVVVMVYPASPLFCAEYMLLYRDLRQHYNTPALYYTMIEGRLRRIYIKHWMTRDVEFVAVSRYVRDRLAEAGFRVTKVVYHGIVRETIEEAERLVPIAKKKLKKLHGDKKVLAVVSHSHPRKGLERLAEACRVLSEKRKDFVVHLVTNSEAARKVSGTPNVYVDTVFGNRSREEVLAFLGAVDALVVPSMAEGFCLPLLEANAMGTPVVHCAFPPLTEISDLEANITFDYDDVRFVYTGEGIEYEYHLYDPRELADAMLAAIELIDEAPSEWEDRCEKVKEHALKFDAEKLYSELLGILGL